MALSIFVPIGYITVLVVSLSIFSRIYRKRTALALAKDHGNSWFTEGHPERDIYQTLVQAAASSSSSNNPSSTVTTTTEGGTSSGAAIPDVVLKAALLNRAMADVKRIIRMRDDKQALSVLLQKGSIGDETMAKFTMAEKELEAEILDVVSEANTFKEGWGQLIFPSASEMVAHLKHKEIYYDIHRQRTEESESKMLSFMLYVVTNTTAAFAATLLFLS
jgi:translocation protein SEC66